VTYPKIDDLVGILKIKGEAVSCLKKIWKGHTDKLKSNITLLSDEFLFVTEFKGEILNWQSKGFDSNGPIIEPYEASFLKYLYISEENSLAPFQLQRKTHQKEG
jgi:hypothetical protein